MTAWGEWRDMLVDLFKCKAAFDGFFPVYAGDPLAFGAGFPFGRGVCRVGHVRLHDGLVCCRKQSRMGWRGLLLLLLVGALAWWLLRDEVRWEEEAGPMTMTDLLRGRGAKLRLAFPGRGSPVCPSCRDIRDFPREQHSMLRANLARGGTLNYCPN